MRFIISLLTFGVILLSFSCQTYSSAKETPTEKIPQTAFVLPTQGDIQMTPSLPTPADPSLQSLIGRIKEDLANRLAQSAKEITLLEVTDVEWTDSSLGCPQPGMDYLQVITPGYRIVFQANGQLYEYHSDKNTNFVYCGDQIPPVIPKP